MKQRIYAVKDIVSVEFQPPFYLKNDNVAVKEFGKACENKDTQWHQYPSDYSLYYLGEFDTETGNIKTEQPTQLANATQFAQQRTTYEHALKNGNQENSSAETGKNC